MIVPYQAFEAADGYMMVAAGNDNLFRRLAAALDRPSLAEDPRFRTNGERVVNRDALVPILADIFKTETRGHWADAARSRRASRTARSTRSTRSSPMRRRKRSAMIQRQPGATVALVGLPLSLRRRAPALRQARAGARRGQRRTSQPFPMIRPRPSLAIAWVALALAACAETAPRNPPAPTAAGVNAAPSAAKPAVDVAAQSSARFIGFIGRKSQHAPPFLDTPGTNYYCLRSFLDRQTGQTAHQLYVAASYDGAERDWDKARDAAGDALAFTHIRTDKITCDDGCSYAEEFAAAIPEPELRTSKDGLAVTFAAHSGQTMTIRLSAAEIAAQLAAVDAQRERLHHAATAAVPVP